MFDTFEHTLSGNVANNATFTVSYPSGRSRADYRFGTQHALSYPKGQASVVAPSGVGFTFNAANITVTNRTGQTLAQGEKVIIQLDSPGDAAKDIKRPKVIGMDAVMITLGTPLTADPNGLVAAATGAELPNNETLTYTFADDAGTSPLDGANQTGVLDIPRNITAAVSHASSVVAMTITVTGRDMGGNTMVETLTIAATGTSQTAAGVKAFSRVDSIAITSAGNATTNTLDLGFGDVLGLPMYLPDTDLVFKELVDGAVPGNAGTLVAGLSPSTVGTATTADVRGTYAPHSSVAPNDAREYHLIALLPDATYGGKPQYAG